MPGVSSGGRNGNGAGARRSCRADSGPRSGIRPVAAPVPRVWESDRRPRVSSGEASGCPRAGRRRAEVAAPSSCVPAPPARVSAPSVVPRPEAWWVARRAAPVRPRGVRVRPGSGRGLLLGQRSGAPSPTASAMPTSVRSRRPMDAIPFLGNGPAGPLREGPRSKRADPLPGSYAPRNGVRRAEDGPVS